MSIERYNKILKQEARLISYPEVKAYSPEITESDILNGYITRYFVQKSNDFQSPIIEINKKSFSRFTNNAFFIAVDLNWKIVGSISEIREANTKSIQFASKTLPSIYLYLPNPLQYRQKENLEI